MYVRFPEKPCAYMTGILQISLLSQHHFLLKGRSKTYKSAPLQRGKVILHLTSINPTPGFVFDTVAQFTTTCPLGLFPLSLSLSLFSTFKVETVRDEIKNVMVLDPRCPSHCVSWIPTMSHLGRHFTIFLVWIPQMKLYTADRCLVS